MTEILLYLTALLIFLLPYFTKNLNFLDILPLFLFYFDTTIVFSNHPPTYQYFECFLIFIFSLNYLLKQKSKNKELTTFGTFLFLGAALIFPIFQAEELNQAVRAFSITFTSIIILPISFNYYSQKSNINNLLKSTYVLIIAYVCFVLVATYFKLGGIESERFAGNTFYFGHVALRGGLTYIGFILLTVPLVYTQISNHRKVILIVLIVVIMIIFFSVLKRFVFVIIGLAIINYFIKPVMNVKDKIKITGSLVILLAVIFSQDKLVNIIETRYNQRGGENKFSIQNTESDIRIFEPFYIFKFMLDKPLMALFIGEKDSEVVTLKHGEEFYEDRKLHNSYGLVLSRLGIIGLLLYLAIYYRLYTKAKEKYNSLKAHKNKIMPYWIVFQNLIIIFIIQGIVGGHDHVTLRGLVFLYLGAIAGYLVHKRSEIKKIEITK